MHQLSADDEANEEGDIDWGDLDLDEPSSEPTEAATVEVVDIAWESPAVDEAGVDGSIDWDCLDGVDATVDFEVVEDSNILMTGEDGQDVAVGKDALTLLGRFLYT